MDVKKIKNMIENLRKELGIEEEVGIKMKPMKRKKATVSLLKKEIRINKNLLSDMSEQELREIIIHELLHLKYGIFHTKEFLEEMKVILSRKP